MRIPLVAAALSAGLVFAGELQAQGETAVLEVEVIDRGVPLTGIQISQFVNGIKARKGATDAGGQAAIPADALDFSSGETVSVWIRRCEDGRVELILVAEGEDDPCADEEAQADERCGCERLGAFLWGDGRLVVDVGARTVSFTPGPSAATPPIEWGDLVSFGATVGATYWRKFEEISGQGSGVTASDATTWSPVVGAFAEAGIPRTGLRVGIAGQYSMLDTEATSGNQMQTGDVKFYGLGLYGRWEFGGDNARTAPYVFGGPFYSWNKGDFEVDGVSDHRVHKTWRGDLGGGVVHWLTPKAGLWGEVHYSPPVGDNDADEHVRLQVGVSVRPMWDACGNSCIR